MRTAERLNNLDDESKDAFVSFTHSLVDKLNVLIRREKGVSEPTPVDFATFVEEVRGECNALARLASMMQGTLVE